ncbi:hypothetical protein COT48_00040, partial [Candidatus Woesearchaeota archaeon CG08_land_8_20_14_0_20_47_9]
MTKTIGMIGGGQLCRMLGEAVEEKRLPFKLIALDPTPKCPGYPYLTKQFVGDFKEEDKIRELAKQSDIITYEIELGNVEILEEIERSGKPVHPSPETLRIIQDKLRQAAFLESKGIPIPRFIGVNNKRELLGAIKELGLPAMLKATKDSYDGRGIFLLQSRDQVDKALSIFAGRGLMLQEFIDFACEVSVIAARSTNGEIKTYPVGENIHWESILLITLVPARINPSTAKRAREIAARTLDVLKGAGVFGIEMFVRRNGDVLINEIAPRVHNSGHYTIEACKTSQFEQHLRAISGMPLGETDLICKRAVMRNILGDTGEYKGPYEIAGAEDLEGIAGVSLHMYGKKEVRQKRKMGHFTLIDNSGEKTAEELIDEVNKLRDIIKLKPVVEMEKPRIEIRTGSDSDIPRIAKAYKFLDSLGIPYAAKILSAHRTPQRMAEEARNLHADGFRVSIAAAGGSAHLPGMTASETLVPVVGLPVKTSTLEGQESLYSIIQMPDGIPVGTVGIGQAESAAILAAQIAYLDNAEIRNKIRRQRGLEELEMGAVSNTALVGVIKPKGVRLPDDKYKELLELVKSLGIEVEELEVSTGDPEAIKSASRKIEEMGGKAIITFAVSDDKASTTQLPGLVSENTDLPTIGLPISDGFAGVKSREEGDIFKKVLYNLSANESGYSVAGMGINRYKNAALYAAQICGLYDPAVFERLKDHRIELSSSVIKKDSLLRKEGVTSFLKDNAGKTKAFTVIDEIKANLNNALKETDLNIGKSRFEGKVRDNYIFDDKRIIVTTDRISCFD